MQNYFANKPHKCTTKFNDTKRKKNERVTAVFTKLIVAVIVGVHAIVAVVAPVVIAAGVDVVEDVVVVGGYGVRVDGA